MHEHYRKREEKLPEHSALEVNLGANETTSAFKCGYCRDQIPDGESQLATCDGVQRPYHRECLRELKAPEDLERRIAQSAQLLEKYDSKSKLNPKNDYLIPEVLHQRYQDLHHCRELYGDDIWKREQEPNQYATKTTGSIFDLISYASLISILHTQHPILVACMTLIMVNIYSYAKRLNGTAFDSNLRIQIEQAHNKLLAQRKPSDVQKDE